MVCCAAASFICLQVNWDKGRALLHLLEVLGLQEQADVLPIYIGDDKTDEDAFKAIQGPNSGVGILVSTKAKPTAAAFTVRDPDEVAAFLKMLVQFGTSCANGWWNHKDACNGWMPAHLRHSISAPAGLVALGGRSNSSSQPSTPHSAAVAAETQVRTAVAAAVIRPAAEEHHRMSCDAAADADAAAAADAAVSGADAMAKKQSLPPLAPTAGTPEVQSH
jgi:trehalose 6-phosphate phosphatase